MRLFLAFILSFSNPVFARTGKLPIILSESQTSKTVANGDYEDIRIDSNRDGLLDLWVVKNNKTTVFIKFQGTQATSMLFRRNNDGNIQEAQYEMQRKTWALTHSEVRAPRILNGKLEGEAATDDDSCVEANKSVLSELEKFTKELTTSESSVAAEIAVSCENETASTEIQRELAAMLSDRSLSQCLNGEQVKAALPTIPKAELEYYSNKLKLDLKKIGMQEDGKGLITCDNLPAGESIPKGKYVENGKITLSLPKDDDIEKKMKPLKPLILHEMLHRSGVQDDKVVDTLVDVCINKKKVLALNDKSNFQGIFPTKINIEKSQENTSRGNSKLAKEVNSAKTINQARSIASTSMESGGGSNGYNMAKEISSAEVQQSVPSASTLASNISSSDVDEQRSLQSSQRQSAPVLAMADRAMGVMTTPALASDETSSGSSSSSSRERYQARHQGYERDSSSAKSADNTDYSKVIFKPSRGGGNVVEEIDLTKGSSTGTSETAGRTTNAVGNSRTVASTGRPTDRFSEPSEVASGAAGGSSSGGGGSGTYFADGAASSSGTRKTNASNRRGLASQGSGGGFESSRDEVITFISNANYSQTKTKLRDQAFQQTLSNNQISIIYADGSAPVGALRGTTVFLDDGSRFIMQRRK